MRNILSLGEGYSKRAYPEFSLIINKLLIEIDNEDIKKLNTRRYYVIEDVVPMNLSFLGYPRGSKIRYYINSDSVRIIQNDTEYFTIIFSDDFRLVIYNISEYENIISYLQAIWAEAL